MLSGRGIDGELKSKFGEWSEKFWKSGAKNEDLRAIYLANVGESNGGGKKLSELKSNGDRRLITTENGSEDKVQSLFSVCVGGKSDGNGCKENNNNSSVVLVGKERLNEEELTGNWTGWAVVTEPKGELRHEFKFNDLKLFTDSGGELLDDGFGKELQIEKLRKIFENAETAGKGSFAELQVWFCPGGNGSVKNTCRNDLTKRGHLSDDSRAMSFSDFFREKLRNGSLWTGGFKDNRDKLVSLLLLLELWNLKVSDSGAISVKDRIKNKFTSNGFSQDLSSLRLLTYRLSHDGSSIDELRADDKAKVGEINLTQGGHNGSGRNLVIGSFDGHLGVRFGGETISSDWFGQLDSGYLRRLWKEFRLETDIIELFNEEKSTEGRMWLLITLLLNASFDLSQELSVAVRPTSNNRRVILQNLIKND